MSIETGKTYPFYSTALSNADVTPWSGQVVKVLGPVTVLAPGDEEVEDCEPLYQVRAADGHEFMAYEGELNGYYFETGQYVGHPNFGQAEV